MTVGGAVLSMLVGRKRGRKLSTVSRRMSNAAKQRGDVKRAKENVKVIEAEIQELEAQAEAAVADIAIHSCLLLWAPRSIAAASSPAG